MIKLEDQEWVINPNTGHKINMVQLLKDQRTALFFVSSKYPFFEPLLKKLKWIYTFQVPTQATDGTRLFVNPEFTAGLSMKMKCFVMMHECMHCSFNHMARGKNHEHGRSNTAADYEVNGHLCQSGIVTKSDLAPYLYSDKYCSPSVWAYEHIYDVVHDESGGEPQMGGQQGNGNPQDSGDGESQMGGQQGNGNPQDKEGGQASQASAKSRKEAAQASGNSKTPGGVISQEAGADIARSEGYDEEDCKITNDSTLTREWESASIEACSKNNSPGLGSAVSSIKDLYLTKHDWKGELRKYIGRALSNIETDSKYGKRKYLANDEVKKYDKQGTGDLSDIIFMIDCSGSISDGLLKRILSECYTIVYKKGIEKVTYVYYDDGVRQVESVEKIKEADKIPGVIVTRLKSNMAKGCDVHGRGGNQETHALEQILQMTKHVGNKKKELMLWFTDGYTYSKPSKPREVKNMIWVVYDNLEFTAPDNSRVIHIKSGDIGR